MNYIDQNKKWLYPLISTLGLFCMPLFASEFGAPNIFPDWLNLPVLIIGSVLTGIGVMFTDSVSARLITWFAFVLVMGFAVFLLYDLLIS